MTMKYVTPFRMAINKKTVSKRLAEMWRKGNSCIVGGNENWWNHWGKHEASSKN